MSKAMELWTRHVEGWQRSGLSVAGYARQEGLNEVTLGTWKRRLVGRRARSVEFVEVTEAMSAAPALVLEVRGCRIAVPNDFDAPTLLRLVSVLEARQ